MLLYLHRYSEQKRRLKLSHPYHTLNDRVIPLNFKLLILMFIALPTLTACQHLQSQHQNTDEHLTTATQDSRPNFLWLISEDNSPEYLRLYNPNEGAATPNIEKLAKHGVTFQHAFSNSPVCSTARSTLALGMYGPQTGTMNHRAFVPLKLPTAIKSIYLHMKAAGYYVSNDVKTDFNFVAEPGTFSDSRSGAHWRDRGTEQAFFHIKSFKVTHENTLMFSEDTIEGFNFSHDPSKVSLSPYHPDTQLFRKTKARYLDAHLSLDKQVGEVIQQLVEDGQLENTFIFYFADHGGVLPGSKGFANEQGLQVPLVVRLPENFRHLWAPGFSKNTNVEGFVSFVDFAPTILNLAGVEALEQHVGRAFLGQNVSQRGLNKRQVVFGFADRFGEKFDFVRTVRLGDFKYVRNYLPYLPEGVYQNYRFKNLAYQEWYRLYLQGLLTPMQQRFFKEKPVEALYNVKLDPFEQQNLIGQLKHLPIHTTLKSMLKDQQLDMPDLGFLSEFYFFNTIKDKPLVGDTYRETIQKLMVIADMSLLPFKEVEEALAEVLVNGSDMEVNWALITLSRFGASALSLTEQVTFIAHNSSQGLLKARALDFLLRSGAINQVRRKLDYMTFLAKIIERSNNQLEVLEIMNIAAGLKHLFGYGVPIKWNNDWHSLPGKTSQNYIYKNRLNHSTKVRFQYLSSEAR